MHIGITGATGFIGSYLRDFLARDGNFPIKALVRTLSHDGEAQSDSVTWLKGDLQSSADCADFVDDLDVIIHLAHTNTPLTSNRDLAADAQANLVPSLHLLKAIKDAGRRPHLIYSSSGGAIYGLSGPQPRGPFQETDPCFPSTSYGIQKLAFESYLRMAAHEGWLQATALRIGNPYGVFLPPERMQGFIGVVLHQIRSGKPIKIFGNPENVRDYIHLDDVCGFIQRILIAREDFQVFNVGSGKGYSVNEILSLTEKISGHTIVRHTLQHPEGDRYLVPWIVLSVEKAAKELNWRPEIALEDGIRSLHHSLVA